MKPKYHSSHSERGFTLVEILVAAVVIGFVILGIMWTEKQRWSTLASSSRVTESLRAIEQKIESRRIGVFATKILPDTATTTTSYFGEITVKDSIGAAVNFDGSIVNNARSLTLWATWPSGKDTIRISTVVTRDF
jgi:prepilin-type N-terminal cleavage/methylation domain-containing protein